MILPCTCHVSARSSISLQLPEHNVAYKQGHHKLQTQSAQTLGVSQWQGTIF